jgi:hypothetical protein
VTESSPGHTIGLSAIHVIPVLAFTCHDHARIPHPRIGRVLLSAAQHLSVLLARRPRVLDVGHIGLISEYLAREMPPTTLAAATLASSAVAATGNPNTPQHGQNDASGSAPPTQTPRIPQQRPAPVAVPIRARPAPPPEPPQRPDTAFDWKLGGDATKLMVAKTNELVDAVNTLRQDLLAPDAKTMQEGQDTGVRVSS